MPLHENRFLVIDGVENVFTVTARDGRGAAFRVLRSDDGTFQITALAGSEIVPANNGRAIQIRSKQ